MMKFLVLLSCLALAAARPYDFDDDDDDIMFVYTHGSQGLGGQGFRSAGFGGQGFGGAGFGGQGFRSAGFGQSSQQYNSGFSLSGTSPQVAAVVPQPQFHRQVQFSSVPRYSIRYDFDDDDK